MSEWFKESDPTPIVAVDGILRSGKISGATIKGKIQVNLAGEEDEESLDEEEKLALKHEEEKARAEAEEAGGERWEKILAKVNPVAEKYPFNIMKQPYLDHLKFDS